MRVFISHKSDDSYQAAGIARYLDESHVPYYLDVLDDDIEASAGRLTRHLQDKVRQSTHLMAVLSQKTRLSWWVPFEIGLATECGNPICTYLLEAVDPPTYLEPWPFLRTKADLGHYVSLLSVRHHLSEDFAYKTAAARSDEAGEFQRTLKSRLGQSVRA